MPLKRMAYPQEPPPDGCKLLAHPDAAKAGPLVDSGFQANLSALLVRLGSEHPHHTLYQVGWLAGGRTDVPGVAVFRDLLESALPSDSCH